MSDSKSGAVASQSTSQHLAYQTSALGLGEGLEECLSLPRPLPIHLLSFVSLEFIYCSLLLAITLTLKLKVHALDWTPLHSHAACFNRFSCNNKPSSDAHIRSHRRVKLDPTPLSPIGQYQNPIATQRLLAAGQPCRTYPRIVCIVVCLTTMSNVAVARRRVALSRQWH